MEVEPDISVENAQLIDSENVSITENATISKSAVQSLYSLFPELPELPKLHLQTSPTLAKEHSEVLSSVFHRFLPWGPSMAQLAVPDSKYGRGIC